MYEEGFVGKKARHLVNCRGTDIDERVLMTDYQVYDQ